MIVAVSMAPAQAQTSARARYDIPSLPVIDALVRFGVLTGISVGGDVFDTQVRTKTVRGRMSAADALQRMMQGTGLRAVSVGPRAFRLVRTDKVVRARPAVTTSSSVDDPPGPDIVVTASKRATPRWAETGITQSVYVGGSPYLAGGGASVSTLANQIPSLTSTALGPGRNKLFVRGVADSSLSGESQATLAEYFGEARTNYNGPDPGLLLYDVDRVDLVKGPQGTLYGAAAVGGVLRIEPVRPDLGRLEVIADTSATLTSGGAPGGSVSATVNLPVRMGSAALRAVGYRQVDGGFIDDLRRGHSNVNRTVTTGGRVGLRLAVGAFTADVSGVRQAIRNRGSQYSYLALPGLSRATSFAEPSQSDFSLVNIELSGRIADANVVSTTSVQHRSLKASYDATSLLRFPAMFMEDRQITAVAHETRLSRSEADGSGWVFGMAAFVQAQKRHRELPGYNDPTLTSGYADQLIDLAAFGNYSWRKGPVLLTLGSRLSYASLEGRSKKADVRLGRSQITLTTSRLLPMALASWRVGPDLTFSLGYREGYRQAGLQFNYGTQYVLLDGMAQYVTGNYFSTFQPDRLRVASTSFGYQSHGQRPLALDVTLSVMRWSNTQADRIDDTGGLAPGFLRVHNGGTIGLLNVDASLSWQAFDDLQLRSGGSLVRGDFSDFLGTTELHELPSIPAVSSFAGLRWRVQAAKGWQAQLDARISYRGKSRLGPGFLHDVVQGDVTTSLIGVSMVHDGFTLSLIADNLLNDTASTFGYGNPFTVASDRQGTPQRPRSLTLSLRVSS